MNQTRHLRSRPGLIPRAEDQAPNRKVTGVALHPRPEDQDLAPAPTGSPPGAKARPGHGGPRRNIQPTGIRILQPDFSPDATPPTPPEDPSPGHPVSTGAKPPGNQVHQTIKASFHSSAPCENPGTYCRIGFSYKSLRQGPPRAPSLRSREIKDIKSRTPSV